MPRLNFQATVKLHGTNAGVRIDKDFNVTAQSRSRDLTLEFDNAGFAAYIDYNKECFVGMREALDSKYPGFDNLPLVIFGEWCGGSIQKGIALNELEKMFVVFGVCYIDEGEKHWLPDNDLSLISYAEIRLYNVNQFQTWNVEIDFENPKDIQNELIRITEEVERSCPVGKALGVDGIGEGIVLTCNTDMGRFQFKSKGEKHSSSRVKKLNSVNVEELNSIKEFVDYAVTENRLEQMAQESISNDFDRKNLGAFIKAVSRDIIKEESDVLFESGLTMRDVGSSLSTKSRKWFFDQEKQL